MLPQLVRLAPTLNQAALVVELGAPEAVCQQLYSPAKRESCHFLSNLFFLITVDALFMGAGCIICDVGVVA